jgi:isoleucyl-tRNA synthetase
LIYLSDKELRATIEPLNVSGNGIDELRYLFLTSKVQLLDTRRGLKGLKTLRVQGQDNWDIGVVNAAEQDHNGKLYQKCDRCWNYSSHVGESAEHPLLCERCIPALAGEF